MDAARLQRDCEWDQACVHTFAKGVVTPELSWHVSKDPKERINELKAALKWIQVLLHGRQEGPHYITPGLQLAMQHRAMTMEPYQYVDTYIFL